MLSLRGGRPLDDSVNRVLAGESLELQLALVLELDVAGALSQLPHDGGGKNLAAAGLVGDARGQDDVLAVEVGLLPDCFAGMDPDAQADGAVRVLGQVPVDRPLDRASTLDGATSTGERDHETVPLLLHLEPAVLLHL